MTVCKFFQQGSCRYGQNCRFEHIYGSKYSYYSNSASQQAPPSAPAVTDEQLVNQVQSDIQAAIRGGQWLLSFYAPFKEKPALPGLNDLSPEEARLLIYEARANNTLDQIVPFLNNLFKEARTKYEQLLLKNSNITKVLRSLYKGEHVTSPFGAQENTFVDNAASSIFRSAIQAPIVPSGQSIFGQSQPSIFAQNTPPGFQTSTNPDPAQSIFAQATQSSFGQSTNVFGVQTPVASTNSQGVFGQADPAKSLFAQATQNVFSNVNTQSQPAFANTAPSQPNLSPFGQTPSNNIFQQPQAPTVTGNQNLFQVNNTQPNTTNANVYGKMEDLSPEEIEAYKSDEFKLGFVPVLPPPKSFCV